MTLRLQAILKEKKISEVEYKTYLLFAAGDGKTYLDKMVESVFMEEPIQPTEDVFAWHDGRRSILRDIKMMVNKVQFLLEQSHDG